MSVKVYQDEDGYRVEGFNKTEVAFMGKVVRLMDEPESGGVLLIKKQCMWIDIEYGIQEKPATSSRNPIFSRSPIRQVMDEAAWKQREQLLYGAANEFLPCCLGEDAITKYTPCCGPCLCAACLCMPDDADGLHNRLRQITAQWNIEDQGKLQWKVHDQLPGTMSDRQCTCGRVFHHTVISVKKPPPQPAPGTQFIVNNNQYFIGPNGVPMQMVAVPVALANSQLNAPPTYVQSQI